MRMSESAVGRLVTETLQSCPEPEVSDVAAVTSACASFALARSAHAVSARASPGTAFVLFLFLT